MSEEEIRFLALLHKHELECAKEAKVTKQRVLTLRTLSPNQIVELRLLLEAQRLDAEANAHERAALTCAVELRDAGEPI